jgi:hypothetical protein
MEYSDIPNLFGTEGVNQHPHIIFFLYEIIFFKKNEEVKGCVDLTFRIIGRRFFAHYPHI